MKKGRNLIAVLLVMITVVGVFPCGVFAASQTYRDVDLKIGDVLNSGSFINLSGAACIRYYKSTKDEKATETFVFEAGREPAVKSFWDRFDWVVLENSVEDGVRNISLYPYVNGGTDGVGVTGLITEETVLGASWMDFNDCRGKTRTIRYFKEGENEPFYTQTSGNRYMQVLKRAETGTFDALGYSVSYWHVKNVDSWSGTVDLIAGRDIGLANMIKANEMYRTQIIPAGTLLDYSAARYISFHFYTSEYTYDKGQEFYCFDYDDRKEGEERFHIAGLGFPYPAYQVMSANEHHVHLVALEGCYPMPDESVVYAADLQTGDVLYNGTVFTFDSANACTVRYHAADGTLIAESGVSSPEGIVIANPEGVNAGSWAVSAIDLYTIDLTELAFCAEGLLIPSDENQDKDYYSGACRNFDGKNYYYYQLLSVAVADAKVNASLSLKDIIGEKNVLIDTLGRDCDCVLLLKNVDKIDARIGASTGIGKGIVIDFNGHSASRVCLGTVPARETLVFTNSREKKSYITGADAVMDENTRGERTGNVVFDHLHIASKIHPAMHTIYLLNGEYVLNAATVMDNDLDNRIVKDTESCPLYKFYDNYPYWACSLTPADPTLDYPNGKKVEKNGKVYYFYTDAEQANGEARNGDVINSGNAIPSKKPTIGGADGSGDDGANGTATVKIILTVVIVVIVAGGIAVCAILLIRKKKAGNAAQKNEKS